MDMMKNTKGITLVVLAVTIIVLLILAGISFVIANNLIINKAILASNKTVEAALKEQIELAWVDVETLYWIKLRKNPSLVRKEHFREEFPKSLQNLEDVKDITISDENETTLVKFKYKNNEFTFHVSERGEATYVKLLRDNVKVGDYIQYPIEYTDLYSKKYYTASNGWRVIDDGKMEGTSGQVRIISTGIPVLWEYYYIHYENNQKAVNNLIHNFENLDFLNDLDGTYRKGSSFKDETMAELVTTISLSEFNHAYNQVHKTNRKPDDNSSFESKNDLFYLEQSYYWLATNSNDSDTKIYFVSKENIREDDDVKNGIRPVIGLKDNLTGVSESGVWKIMK